VQLHRVDDPGQRPGARLQRLAAKGYNTVTTDDCWMQAGRDADGNLQADPSRFPDGMAYVGQQLHALGLKFGIYEDAGTSTCGGYAGSWGHW
jgi:alpha-galactosidase